MAAPHGFTPVGSERASARTAAYIRFGDGTIRASSKLHTDLDTDRVSLYTNELGHLLITKPNGDGAPSYSIRTSLISAPKSVAAIKALGYTTGRRYPGTRQPDGSYTFEP